MFSRVEGSLGFQQTVRHYHFGTGSVLERRFSFKGSGRRGAGGEGGREGKVCGRVWCGVGGVGVGCVKSSKVEMSGGH